MPDVFISYTSSDEALARFVHNHLLAEKVTSFLASASLQPGEKWSPEVLKNLKFAKWVLFLASRAACQSPYVQQEVGAAIVGDKRVVPIIWDIDPSQLPGWASQYQALNMANRTYEDLRTEVVQIAQRIKQEQWQGLLAVGLIFAGLAAIAK